MDGCIGKWLYREVVCGDGVYTEVEYEGCMYEKGV